MISFMVTGHCQNLETVKSSWYLPLPKWEESTHIIVSWQIPEKKELLSMRCGRVEEAVGEGVLHIIPFRYVKETAATRLAYNMRNRADQPFRSLAAPSSILDRWKPRGGTKKQLRIRATFAKCFCRSGHRGFRATTGWFPIFRLVVALGESTRNGTGKLYLPAQSLVSVINQIN